MTNETQKTAIERPAEPDYAAYGRELVHSGLYGGLLAGGGAALYHLINGARNAQLPSATVLNDINVPKFIQMPSLLSASEQKPTGKRPKAKKRVKVENDEAGGALKAAQQKTAAGILHTIYDALGRVVPTQFLPDIPTPADTGPESPTVAHRGWRTAANYAAAIGGGMGGLALVRNMAEKKRREELDEEVDSARKEYFNALTGKTAAELDLAYAAYEKSAVSPAPPAASWWDYMNPANWGKEHRSLGGDVERTGETLWTAALLSALGTGAIGAKYMYDQTKDRTRAENLRRAAASRARLQSIQQTPWVDPGELSAVAGR